MTVRAIAGLFVFNLALCGVGTALLVAARPRTPRRSLLRLAGVSYLVGLAAVMVALTMLLMVGVPLRSWTLLLVAGGLAGGGVLVARARLASPEEYVVQPLLTLASVIPAAALVVILEALFRRGRLQGLTGFDEWDSWGPMTKDLYLTGHLRSGFMASFPGGSYPPGLRVLLASALQAIGSPDMTTIHLELWFVALGFAAAAAALLAERVRAGVLMPFVLLVFVMPNIRARSVALYGDLALGYLVATMALLIWLWLEDEEGWPLALATVVGASATLTKREGILFVGCAVLAGAAASQDRRRRAWPRLTGVLVGSGVAYAAWSVWLHVHLLPGNGPQSGVGFVTDVHRGWASARAIVQDVFSYDLWLVATILALVAFVLAVVSGFRTHATYVGTFLGLSTAGCILVLWSTPSLSTADVDVVSRLVGTVAIASAVLTPIVIQEVVDAGALVGASALLPERLRRANLRPLMLIVLAWAALSYPAAVVASGRPQFPDASDCVTPVRAPGPVAAVFGSASSYAEASRLQASAARASGQSVAITKDGCGGLRVYAAQPLTTASTADLVQRSNAAGLQPTLVDPRIALQPGAPTRPSTFATCGITPTPGQQLDAVFVQDVYFWTANDVERRALAAGFTQAHIEKTSCDRFRVVVTGIVSAKVAQTDFEHETTRAGFRIKIIPPLRYPTASSRP